MHGLRLGRACLESCALGTEPIIVSSDRTDKVRGGHCRGLEMQGVVMTCESAVMAVQ
jgi:hypothetical protein